MLSHLDRKLWRDLRRMAGQAIAVVLVMACGLAMMTMARSLIHSLESTRREYYEANRFAEVFAHLKRAPLVVAARAAAIPGVAAVQTALSVKVTLDIPGLDEPASGEAQSLPDSGQPELNRLFLRAGRWLTPGARDELLVGEAFAEANHLHSGDTIAMLLNGKRQELRMQRVEVGEIIVADVLGGLGVEDLHVRRGLLLLRLGRARRRRNSKRDEE